MTLTLAADLLRWAILRAAGRLLHRTLQSIVRIAGNWPTTDVILGAYRRIDLHS